MSKSPKNDGKAKSAAGNAKGSKLLRTIPQVDRLLGSAEFEPLIAEHSRAVVTRHVRDDLGNLRRRAAAGGLDPAELEPAAIHRRVTRGLAAAAVPYYCRVINATGVVLHTGLGRAPIAAPALRALSQLAGHPLRVEIDLESGERGGRDEGCSSLLRELTGAEAATVVNNNAGATLLILAALARGKKVILSRGEMVEIGGSFRVPEIMEEGGATLVGVGTTNRTHPRDYEEAIDADTAMILKVHTSNYRIEGFTSEVEIEELVDIGRRAGVPVVHDLGSGCLIDLAPHGLAGEPYVQRSVKAGAELICFSGDKLLGGPQAGIIIGSKQAVDRCARHPLYRAMRPGRLTYVALEATLRVYLEGEDAVMKKIPAMQRLAADIDELRRRARRLAKQIATKAGITCEVARDSSQAGSGALPARNLPTWVVRIAPAAVARTQSAAALAAALRRRNPPILARVHTDAVHLDLRTIDDTEFGVIVQSFRGIVNGTSEHRS